MEKNIIGRTEEIKRQKDYISSDRSEFIAIYGRKVTNRITSKHLLT